MIDDQSPTPHITSRPFCCSTLQSYYRVPRVIPHNALLCSVAIQSWSSRVISSFTIPDTALSFNTSSVNLEGGPSYVHLHDYIEWNPPGVIPRVFPLMFGHTVTLTLLETFGKVGWARRASAKWLRGTAGKSGSPRVGWACPCRIPSRRGDGVTLSCVSARLRKIIIHYGLGICFELASGLYALTTTRD